MEKTYILGRTLQGFNYVKTTSNGIRKNPGVIKFSEFIGNLEQKLETNEIKEILYLKKEDIDNLIKSGYISGDSQRNILRYIEAKNAVEKFKELQFGAENPEHIKKFFPFEGKKGYENFVNGNDQTSKLSRSLTK